MGAGRYDSTRLLRIAEVGIETLDDARARRDSCAGSGGPHFIVQFCVRSDLCVSTLIRKGREVVITDRGRPVARLVPVREARPFPDLKPVRAKARGMAGARVTGALLENRDDRL